MQTRNSLLELDFELIQLSFLFYFEQVPVFSSTSSDLKITWNGPNSSTAKRQIGSLTTPEHQIRKKVED